MISCLSLERPGHWRGIGMVAVFVVVMLPALPLLWRTVTAIDSATAFVSASFIVVLQNSAMVALLVAGIAFIVGLPTGVLTALYEFPGRKMFLAIVVLPLLVPSFLWAVGWSALAARLGPPATELVSGFAGCLLVLSMGTVPLVLLISYASTMALSGSQLDAARLAGGEKTVLRYVLRYVVTPVLLAAGLGGVLTLSDPGPGQIFGLRTAAAEILTSFSALYDFSLAGRQCVVLAALVLMIAAPLVFLTAPRLASEVMAKQSHTAQRVQHRGIAGVTMAVLSFVVLLGVAAPLRGLTLPLTDNTTFQRAWGELARTAINTLVYAVGAGTTAAILGLLLAFCVGRNNRLRTICVGMSLALFALPPALITLGLVQLATAAPAWADLLFRSRLTTCVALGLRFFPIAAILGLRAWGSLSASWTFSAGIHGVPLATYLRRVVLPLLLPATAVAVLLVALLATADVSTLLLLHPPGERSLPLAIFTVMANAPESLVASLCLVYVSTAAVLLTAAWILASKGKL
jgi:iron(III) transport system permease protein